MAAFFCFPAKAASFWDRTEVCRFMKSDLILVWNQQLQLQKTDPVGNVELCRRTCNEAVCLRSVCRFSTGLESVESNGSLCVWRIISAKSCSHVFNYYPYRKNNDDLFSVFSQR